MATHTKVALKVGQTYHSPDGEVKVTAARLKHWKEQFARLQAANYSVPMAWDHSDKKEELEPLPKSKVPSAKNTVGTLAAFELAPDGNAAELTLDITDPVAQGRADRNEVYVSPVIFDQWADGAKNEYTDIITHVDMVNHPVDHSQEPFRRIEREPGVIACALRMGTSTKIYCLSSEKSAVADEDDDKKPEDDDKPSKKGEGDADEDTGDESEEIVDNSGKLRDVIGTLGEMQIVLSEDTDESNFLDHLHQALLTAKAMRSGDTPADQGAQGGSKVSDPGVATMSLDPKKNPALAFAEKSHRNEIKSRLDALLKDGKCTPVEHEAHAKTLPAIRLSLDASGEPEVGDLEKFIASREAVPAGTFWDASKRVRMSTVAEAPSSMQAELTPEEVQNRANWALGRKPAKA